jgi:ATP-dependent DNA helicase RecG
LKSPQPFQGCQFAWKGHYYSRNGESLTALNIEKVERIRNQVLKTDWSAQIINGAAIKDLSENAIEEAKNQFIKKNPHLSREASNWSAETFLNKAKITINSKITRTAILLLGKPESEHYINPATAKISWVLQDRDTIEKDYAHFSCPLLLSVEKTSSKIRNLNYRYMQEGTLFPQEVLQFDPYIIREALNNCIAHQDYTLGGKINVVEREDGILIFTNSGSFIPKNIEKVIEADAPENVYRNPFLSNAMVNLNMIDTIGSGIKKMYIIQKNKFFPLPDYDFADDKVKVTITGKVLDLAYSRKLAEKKDLTLHEIILLDKIAKQKTLSQKEIAQLKTKNLIEGRKPNFYISSSVAKITGERAKYIKQRGINDEYYMRMIIDYIKEFGEGRKTDFEKLLLDKLPEILDITQKKTKIKNILQKLKKEEIIYPKGKVWKMSKRIT